MKVAVVFALLIAVAACDRETAPSGETAADSSVVARITRGADSGEVHIIRVVANGGEYAFEPDALTVESGDVVRFVHTSHQPESIAFLAGATESPTADFLREAGALDAVLLTRPGQVYDVSFAEAPPGRYAFTSTTHPEMAGAVVVRD